MDLDFLLGCVIVLLIGVVVLLSVIVYRIAEGFRTTFNYLKDIEAELIDLGDHFPSAEEYREEDGEEPH